MPRCPTSRPKCSPPGPRTLAPGGGGAGAEHRPETLRAEVRAASRRLSSPPSLPRGGGAGASAISARYLQVKHLNRQRHLAPTPPRRAVHFRGTVAAASGSRGGARAVLKGAAARPGPRPSLGVAAAV